MSKDSLFYPNCFVCRKCDGAVVDGSGFRVCGNSLLTIDTCLCEWHKPQRVAVCESCAPLHTLLADGRTGIIYLYTTTAGVKEVQKQNICNFK